MSTRSFPSTSGSEPSQWQQPLQHTRDATISLLQNFTQSVEQLRQSFESENYGQAIQQLRQVKRSLGTLNNFAHQCQRMNRSVSRYERRTGYSSGSQTTRGNVSSISPQSLPEDAQQLRQIVALANSKLARSAG